MRLMKEKWGKNKTRGIERKERKREKIKFYSINKTQQVILKRPGPLEKNVV